MKISSGPNTVPEKISAFLTKKVKSSRTVPHQKMFNFPF